MIQIPFWIYAAIMAASEAANYQAQRKTSEAQAGVMREERRRRSNTDKANELAAQSTADTLTKTKDREAARAAELADIYNKQAPAPTSGPDGTRFLATGTPQNSTQTIDATNDEISRAMGRVNARGSRLGSLGAFGDVFNEGNLAAGRNAQDIGINSSLFRGWQGNVMPALLARAGEAGRSWGTAADALKLAATIMGPFAMGGGGASAGASGGANSSAGVLDQMGGVPKEFAGKELFGMGGGQPFSPLSAMEKTSIGDAAARMNWSDMQQLGITPQEFMQPSKDELERYMQMLDPYWNLLPGARRRRPNVPVQF